MSEDKMVEVFERYDCYYLHWKRLVYEGRRRRPDCSVFLKRLLKRRISAIGLTLQILRMRAGWN